jgi:hypothetical protein
MMMMMMMKKKKKKKKKKGISLSDAVYYNMRSIRNIDVYFPSPLSDGLVARV